MLEAVAENFAEQKPLVQLMLMTACTKIFFQRPPECQLLLGTVLKAGSQPGVEQVVSTQPPPSMWAVCFSPLGPRAQ